MAKLYDYFATTAKNMSGTPPQFFSAWDIPFFCKSIPCTGGTFVTVINVNTLSRDDGVDLFVIIMAVQSDAGSGR